MERKGILTVMWILWVVTVLSALAFGIVSLLVINGLLQVRAGAQCNRPCCVRTKPATLLDITRFECSHVPIRGYDYGRHTLQFSVVLVPPACKLPAKADICKCPVSGLLQPRSI